VWGFSFFLLLLLLLCLLLFLHLLHHLRLCLCLPQLLALLLPFYVSLLLFPLSLLLLLLLLLLPSLLITLGFPHPADCGLLPAATPVFYMDDATPPQTLPAQLGMPCGVTKGALAWLTVS